MPRFVHLADLHLGYEQYGLKQRAVDLAAAFRQAAMAAAKEQPDFLLIAGDVFNSRTIDPTTLLMAVEVLRPLQEAGIPVVAVSGNHDRGWHGESQNWLAVLHRLGYLVHLDVSIRQGQLQLHGPDSLSPSYVEFGDTRVVGLPYLGATLPRLVGQLAQALAALPPCYTVLLTHAGLEGQMPGFTQPLRLEQLEPLRPYVQYVALGHLHKPFAIDDWVYNPGSLEALGVDEWDFKGGWYLVETSRLSDGWSHRVRFTPARRRPCARLRLDLGAAEGPEAALQAAKRLAEDNAALAGKDAIVELAIVGKLSFALAALDTTAIVQVLERRLRPLKVLVRNLLEIEGVGAIYDEHSSRDEIEQAVLEQAVANDQRYHEHSTSLANLALALKRMAIAGASDEAVYEYVLEQSASLGLSVRGDSDAD